MAQITAEHAPMMGRMMALVPQLAAKEGCNPYPQGGFAGHQYRRGRWRKSTICTFIMGGPRPWLRG